MASQGFVYFVSTVAMLSAAVGLMNLFPIPILDGGHLVFHAYEAVTRRPPSDRALRVMMAAGLSGPPDADAVGRSPTTPSSAPEPPPRRHRSATVCGYPSARTGRRP
jgi:hypothetical protein